MSTLAVVLRIVALLAFAGLTVLTVSRCRGQAKTRARQVVATEHRWRRTTGPYRLVRHPIYLGLALLVVGEALAFGSWPVLFIALSAIVPTLAWRARAEEKLLSRTFGERYEVYRQRTKMIVPHLL